MSGLIEFVQDVLATDSAVAATSTADGLRGLTIAIEDVLEGDEYRDHKRWLVVSPAMLALLADEPTFRAPDPEDPDSLGSYRSFALIVDPEATRLGLGVA